MPDLKTALEAHRPYGLDCKCGRPINSDADWAGHMDEVIASLPGVAVTQLPEPERTSGLVHNHGTEDGPGIGCHELRLNGRLVGQCIYSTDQELAAEVERLHTAQPRGVAE